MLDADTKDKVDAGLILALVQAMVVWHQQTGQRAPRKPLREALWFYWQEPRLPRPLIRSKYPTSFPWTAAAQAAYRNDSSARLVIEHPEPIALIIDDLRSIPPADAENFTAVLRSRLAFAVVMTPDEDKALTREGLRDRMPKSWKPGDDILARYRAAGLDCDSFAPLTTQD